MSMHQSFFRKSIVKVNPETDEQRNVIKSRWSRLDHYIHKPTKIQELTDVARLLLIAKREEEGKSKRDG